VGRPDVPAARRTPGRDRFRHGAWPLLTAVACLLFARALAAQDGCEFGDEGNDVLRQVTMAGGEAIYYVTRPHMVCDGGIQIWADSAVAFTSTDMAHLIGSVRYEDPRRSLRSDEARYFSAVGRLQAAGSLRIEDRDEGSIVENGALVYLRETSFRSEESMTVTTDVDRVRPVATLTARETPGDSAGTALERSDPRTYVIVGDQILSRGGNYLRSVGSVELTFDSVLAFADTLEYLEVEDHLELRGSASVDAPDYDLAGQRIVLMTPEPAEREIRAVGEAVLTGEDLVLTSERIFLFARDERLHRLVALPPEVDSLGAPTAPARAGAEPGRRPHALADDFEITADSLDVLAPGETLERVFAAGRARSVSHSRDSLNVELLPEVARSDWLEGDTIIVTFVRSMPPPAVDAPLAVDPAAPADPTDPTDPTADPSPESGVSVDRIVAIVGARSLYRMVPSDPGSRPGEDPPAVHYVVGDRITIVMRDGEVDHMEVEGGTSGIHLEPMRPGPQP
jgi:hypothetical protein